MAKTYLMIGSTSEIGQSVAKQIVKNGDCFITIGRDQGTGETHYPCNVTDFQTTLPEIQEELAGLVYLPGTINLKPFQNLTLDEYRKDWEINFLGAVNVLQHYLPQLKKHEGASVVLMSTVAVIQGMPYHASIASAKGAIEGLTRSLAAEFAPKIRINAVAPSLTDTPLAEKLLSDEKKVDHAAKRHPLHRIGQPIDIAQAIYFLLSEQSAWMTGQVLHVDGGLSTLKMI